MPRQTLAPEMDREGVANCLGLHAGSGTGLLPGGFFSLRRSTFAMVPSPRSPIGRCPGTAVRGITLSESLPCPDLQVPQRRERGTISPWDHHPADRAEERSTGPAVP